MPSLLDTLLGRTGGPDAAPNGDGQTPVPGPLARAVMSNPVGTEYTTGLGMQRGPFDPIEAMMPNGNAITGTQADALHQQMRAGSDLATTLMMGMTGNAPGGKGFRGWHGSHADFNAFDDRFIGTGEGAQMYGVGHYIAGNEGTGKWYRDQGVQQKGLTVTDPSSGRVYKPGDPYYDEAVKSVGSPGRMYEVQVNADPAHFLDWDKPLSEQHPAVQKAFEEHLGMDPTAHATAGDAVRYAEREIGDPVEISRTLQQSGVPGIRYLDAGSRGAGTGSSNTVVFDPQLIEILRKYGLAGLMMGGTGAIAGMQGGSNSINQ